MAEARAQPTPNAPPNRHQRRAASRPPTPNAATAHFHRGNQLRAQNQIDQAIAAFREAIAENPSFPEAHNNLANALRLKGETRQAINAYKKAIAANPDFAEAHANLAVSLQEQGDVDQACVELEAALATAPYRGSFHRMLINTGRVTPGSAPYARLEKLEARLEAMAQEDRIELHFAMGTAFADAQEMSRAEKHFLEGNRLKRQRIAYDEAATLAVFPRLEKIFTAEILADTETTQARSQTPIFIVGMPRSGTTLVEQILASHPTVHGAGELPVLPSLASQLARQAGRFPECVPTVSPENMARLGEAYRRVIHSRNPDATHVVDKLPANFQFVGLIALALPGARIIHLRRDPVDTCLSCFAELFTDTVDYSYDLGELARYYTAYKNLMTHWHSVLPPGILLDVNYEDIVTDLPTQAACLLRHCGLPWNDAVLAFHENRRDVRTASAAQVRRPLYATSKGKWHRFAEMAGILVKAMES